MKTPPFNYSVNCSLRMESPLALELSSEVETTDYSKKTPFLSPFKLQCQLQPQSGIPKNTIFITLSHYSVNYSFRDDKTKLMEIPALDYSANYSLRMEPPAILLMIVRMIIIIIICLFIIICFFCFFMDACMRDILTCMSGIPLQNPPQEVSST